VLHEGVDNSGTSTSQLGYKHSPTLVEGVATFGRSTSQNCLPNITLIQQEYNTSIPINNSLPEVSSGCSSEEKAVEDNIPNEAYSVGSIYMYNSADEALIFRDILVDECRASGVDIAKLSRHWLRIFGDRNATIDIKPHGSTSTEKFKTYCGEVIEQYSLMKQQ
jgi:hypothetical protein